MSWDFKMSEAEFVAGLEKAMARADAAMSSKMHKYFELFDPEVIPKAFMRVCEADWKHTEDGDYAKIVEAMNEYAVWLQTQAENVRRPLNANEIKQIHVLKTQAKMEDEEYRALIERISGKQSSKDMEYWEGRILKRALSRIKERRAK